MATMGHFETCGICHSPVCTHLALRAELVRYHEMHVEDDAAVAALTQRAEQAERERDALKLNLAQREFYRTTGHWKDAQIADSCDPHCPRCDAEVATKERDEARAKVERLEKALREIVADGTPSSIDDVRHGTHKRIRLVLGIARAAVEDK